MIFDKKENNFSTDAIKARFIMLLDEKKLSPSNIAQWFGVTRQNIDGKINRNSNFTLEQVSLLKKNIPELNISWFLFGEGEMFEDPIMSDKDCNNYKERIKLLNETVRELREDKQRLVRMNEYLYKIIEKKLT